MTKMPLTDTEIIQRFKIKPTDRILDVGGSMNQHSEIKIDTLVDAIRPEESKHYKSKKRVFFNIYMNNIIYNENS